MYNVYMHKEDLVAFVKEIYNVLPHVELASTPRHTTGTVGIQTF